MIPQLSATSIRQAMRWARDERRLSQACQAVLEFMQRHPIAATWGRSDLASSDMMTMETTNGCGKPGLILGATHLPLESTPM
ncbi:transposase Tn3 family protein [Alicycliphilus sp. B1]|nr:transposase Tn3 family protein [Alicycliphilus sp. B1]